MDSYIENNPDEAVNATTRLLTGLMSNSVTRDLGVLVDDKLRFVEHFEMVTNKAFKSLGSLIRTG